MVNLCCAWNDSWRTQLKFGVGGGTGVQTWRNIFNPLRRLLNLSKQKWRPAHSSSIQSPWFASCPHPISANIIMVLVIFSNGHSAQKPNFTAKQCFGMHERWLGCKKSGRGNTGIGKQESRIRSKFLLELGTRFALVHFWSCSKWQIVDYVKRLWKFQCMYLAAFLFWAYISALLL